jgi:hypothetical protein
MYSSPSYSVLFIEKKQKIKCNGRLTREEKIALPWLNECPPAGKGAAIKEELEQFGY